MTQKNTIFSKSVKDFFSLFISGLVLKILGLIRELIIAASFGGSVELAIYITLKTGIDFLTVVSSSSALQGNLLPKFAQYVKEYPSVSFGKIKRDSLKIALGLFLLSILITSMMLVVNNYCNWNNFLLIFLLSLTTAGIFFSDVGLIINQAKGDFKRFSVLSFINSLIMVLLLIPMSYLFGIIGLALSRFIGVLSVSPFCWKGFNTRLNEKEINPIEFKSTDFNLSIFIVANHGILLVLVGRWLIAKDDLIFVNYYYYAAILLNIFMSVIVRSLSSILLQKISVSKQNTTFFKILLIVLVMSIGVICINFTFSDQIISILFQRNQFTQIEVAQTAKIFRQITIPFVIIYLSSIMVQPILSNKNTNKKIDLVIKMISISLIIIFIIFSFLYIFSSMSGISLLLFFLYLGSITILLLSLFAILRYSGLVSFKGTYKN